jgi:medium-chain acyl-[acyl-carrier-protein] hydrolase
MTDVRPVQLFSLPHAGGISSLYEAWRPLLAPTIELVPIELPGRGRRLSERPLRSLERLTEDLTAGILLSLHPPFAFFGHSMGAVLAFECARTLSVAHGYDPLVLFASGHRAPQLSPRDGRQIHGLDDASFLAWARELSGGLNDALEHAELRDLFLPVLRTDLTAMETYVYRPGRPLACDIVALGGIDDPYVSEAELAAWAEQTTGDFHMQLFPGNHFFIHHKADQVTAEIARRSADKVSGWEGEVA